MANCSTILPDSEEQQPDVGQKRGTAPSTSFDMALETSSDTDESRRVVYISELFVAKQKKARIYWCLLELLLASPQRDRGGAQHEAGFTDAGIRRSLVLILLGDASTDGKHSSTVKRQLGSVK